MSKLKEIFEEKPAIDIVDYEVGDGEIEAVVVNLASLHKEQKAKPSEKKADPKDVLKEEILEKHGSISTAYNGASTKEKYVGRTNYKELFNDDIDGDIDSWYEEPFHGKINPTTGLNARIIFEPRRKKPDKEPAIAPKGIARALADVKKDFVTRQRSPASKFLQKIEYTRVWQEEYKVQNKYYGNLYRRFYTEVLEELQSSDKIKNISDFYEHLKEYIENKEMPFTTSGLAESKYNDVFATGLVYEVYEGEPDSDTEKIEFMNDPNYPLYAYVTKMHGFKIDPNIPWRIIADLSSDKMKKYLFENLKGKAPAESDMKLAVFEDKSEKEVADEIFCPNASYINVSARYNGFVGNLLGFYRQFLDDHSSYFINTSEITTEMSRVTRTTEHPREDPPVIYGKEIHKIPAQWLDWYADIRNIERKKPFNLNKINLLKKRVRQIYNFALQKDLKEFIDFADIAINHIEYSLGTTAAVYETAGKKELTIREKDPTMLLKLIKPPRYKVTQIANQPEATIGDDGVITPKIVLG